MRLKAWHAAVLLVGFAIPVAVAAMRSAPLPTIDVSWPARHPQLPPDTVQDGTELAFIYIGSSTCVWCQASELPGLVDTIRNAVATQAADAGLGFSAIGVSVDFDIEAGFDQLRKMGPFHEISTGRGWLNIGVLKYVWDEHTGSAATPQIVVIRRPITRSPTLSVSRGDVLVRRIGLDEIEVWSAAGALLPKPRGSVAATTRREKAEWAGLGPASR